MNNYSSLNDPQMYRNLFEEIGILNALNAVFALKDNEKIQHTSICYSTVPVDEIAEMIDEKDSAIIEEIARSKYLTSRQIYGFINLRGYKLDRIHIRKKINRLVKLRLIQENEIIIPEALRGIRYYELDIKGYLLAKEWGINFNMGNRYLSFNKRAELGIVVTPADVKRILVGNQIVLGLLFSNAKMERFGIMETLRPDAYLSDSAECIIRTSALVKIEDDSILAYEVVRDCPEAYEKLADKLRRYYKMIHNNYYLISNHHGDAAFPQLIICGESLEHNRRIVEYLRTNGLWNSDDTLLFTEDLLNMNNSLRSIYEFTEDDKIRWYSLPQEECESSLTAAVV